MQGAVQVPFPGPPCHPSIWHLCSVWLSLPLFCVGCWEIIFALYWIKSLIHQAGCQFWCLHSSAISMNPPLPAPRKLDSWVSLAKWPSGLTKMHLNLKGSDFGFSHGTSFVSRGESPLTCFAVTIGSEESEQISTSFLQVCPKPIEKWFLADYSEMDLIQFLGHSHVVQHQFPVAMANRITHPCVSWPSFFILLSFFPGIKLHISHHAQKSLFKTLIFVTGLEGSMYREKEVEPRPRQFSFFAPG